MSNEAFNAYIRAGSPYGDGEGLEVIADWAGHRIADLEAQLAEARELLISSWTPTDDTGKPCLEWVKRRNALLGWE